MAKIITATLTGGAATEVDLPGTYGEIQIVFSGRATGTVGVETRSVGSVTFRDTTPSTNVALTSEDTVIIEPAAINGLRFDVSAGDDVTVTVILP